MIQAHARLGPPDWRASLEHACQAASPDFAMAGPDLLSPTPVRPLTSAQVLWRNDRWLLEAGVDITQAAIAREIDTWLVETFAVAVDDTGERPGYGADRYGATGGALHGGSGRCVSHGRFNAKGVGRTRLVPEGLSGGHSDGMLPLGEAIREAINAEIAHAELPHGAVPIIAILDPDDHRLTAGRRRAIVVRPNFWRPAHLERSIFFGRWGLAGDDQRIDAARVRQVFDRLDEEDPQFMAGQIETCLQRLARQVGAGHALKLWPGRLLTSNTCLDGRIVDLASFRAVPGWRKAIGEPDEIFGDELNALLAALHSLSFQLVKHRRAPVDVIGLKAALPNLLRAGFEEAAALGLGLGDLDGSLGKSLVEALWEYFSAEQRRPPLRIGQRAARRTPGLYEVLCGAPARTSAEADLAALLDKVCGLRARQWLRPRPRLFYEIDQPRTETLVKSLPEDPPGARAAISRHIDHMLSMARRQWRQPPGFIRRRQAVRGACNILLGELNGQSTAILQAPRLGEAAVVGNEMLELSTLGQRVMATSTTRVTLRGVARLSKTGEIKIDIGGLSLPLDRSFAA